MSVDHPIRVRECASALKAAIAGARADGYRVDGVGNIDDIAVSVTAKVQRPQVVIELVIDSDTSGADRFAKAMESTTKSTRKSVSVPTTPKE